MHNNPQIMDDAISLVIEEWGMLINFGLGIATLLGLLAFGYALTLLIKNSDNPHGRDDAIKRLFKAGITTTVIGAFWLVVGLIYGMFI